MEDNLKKIKTLLTEKTGFNANEITQESFIGDDLNIGEFELMEILTELEEQVGVDLISRKEDIETVQDILDILEEESEL